MTKPNLFLFSPMPPALNGIADYSATLVAELARYYRCCCVLADDAPAPLLPPGVKYLFLSQYRKIAREAAQSPHLFQIGNNSGHAYMLPWVERVPGVVIIHDLTLAHLMDWVAGQGGQGSAYRRLAKAAHDASGLAFLENAADNSLWSGEMGQELTFLRPLLVNSRGVIVHSRLGRLRISSAMPDARVHVIPHFATSTIEGMAERKVRAGQPVRLLCFGFVARAKRIDLVLGALALLRANGLADVQLTIAGQVRPEEVDIEPMIAAFGLRDVELVGYVDEAEIDGYLAEADIVLNLRDPTSGETSGTLSRAMAAGCCVVVTDVGTYSELPDDCVLKVARQDMTAEGLAQRLWRAVTMPDERYGIGERAQAFALNTAAIEEVGRRYRDAIEASRYEPTAISTHRTFDFMPAVRNPTVERIAGECGAWQEAHQLWWRERLLPFAGRENALLIINGGQTDSIMAGKLFDWTVAEAGLHIVPDDIMPGVSAILMLVDEAAMEDVWNIVRWLDMLIDHLLPESVTFDIVNPDKLPEMLVSLMAERMATIVHLVEGPEKPLLAAPSCIWLSAAWGATFVLPAAPRPL